MKSKSNKNLGLSPIKQNKYSIRKFKLGAASVTVASLLIFGTAGVAKAAEVHGADKAQQAEHVANVAKSDTAKATEAPPAASTQQNEVKTSEAPNTAKAVTDKEAITPTAAPKEDKVVSDKATTQDKKETRGYKANNTEPQKELTLSLIPVNTIHVMDKQFQDMAQVASVMEEIRCLLMVGKLQLVDM